MQNSLAPELLPLQLCHTIPPNGHDHSSRSSLLCWALPGTGQCLSWHRHTQSLQHQAGLCQAAGRGVTVLHGQCGHNPAPYPSSTRPQFQEKTPWELP